MDTTSSKNARLLLDEKMRDEEKKEEEKKEEEKKEEEKKEEEKEEERRKEENKDVLTKMIVHIPPTQFQPGLAVDLLTIAKGGDGRLGAVREI